MPSQSAKQHRLMEGIASGSFKKKGLSPSVAKEFVAADKGHKFGSGGHVKKRHKPRMSPAMMAALSAPPPAAAGPPPGMGGPPPGPPMGMKGGGQIKTTKTENSGSQSKIGGGIERKGRTSTAKIGMRGAGRASHGTTPTKMFAGGGMVRGHGAESRGRTKGRFV
jgi:hypothetical protein